MTEQPESVEQKKPRHGESFFAATAVARPERPALTLDLDLDVDVCVVGGGLAGLISAREIARRGWSVVVLEGKTVAWNASGRNTGFVLPGFAQDPRVVVERAGLPRAQILWRLAQAGFDYVRETIDETAMPGVGLTGGGWLWVSKIDRIAEMADEVRFLRATFGANVALWTTEKLRSHLKTRQYFQGVHARDAFHIHPLNYALGLARAAEQAGARIFENSPALSLDPIGVRKRVVTPHARVRAAHVVLAGNVHLGGIMPNVAQSLVPVTTYVVATAPLGEGVREAIDFAGSVSDTEWADNHYRLAGDRLIWSGRMTVHEGSSRHFAWRLRRDIARVYPQLGKVDIDYSWAGTLGNSVHRMPQIGEVVPGLWLASGFGGHGLNTTAMAGNLIARAIVEGNTGWKHFEPFELIWAGGRMGRAAAKIGYLAYTVRHELEAHLSRRRESGRGRKEIADARRAERAWSRLVNEPEKSAGQGASIVQRLRASPIGQKIAAVAVRPSGKDKVNKTAV